MTATTETTALVIGGGATGAGIARDLALRGVDVTLVDRGGLSTGTSGRSHGLLHSGARYAESDPAGAGECADERATVGAIAGAAVADTGGLFVSLADDDDAYVDRKLAACRDVGVRVEELDPDAARERVPGLADDAERVLAVPDAVVYPSRLVAANAADARAHGATVRVDAPVTDLHVDAGTVTGATLDGDDRVDADVVVNATGAWAGEVAALAGVDVEMRPTRGVMVSLDYDGLGPVLNRCREPADGDIVVPHDDQAVVGTTSVVVDDPDDYPREAWEVERSVEECARMLPALADADRLRTWWGVRPLYAPDEAARGSVDSGVGDARGISRDFVVLDHDADGVDRLLTVVGGKLTTYRRMAEAVADRVCERLDVDAPCRTADERLPGADDPARLDALAREFDADGPTDTDVVGGAGDRAHDEAPTAGDD